MCTARGELIRADQIVTISVVAGPGFRPTNLPPGSDVSICTDLPGGTDGDFQTRYHLARCDPEAAPALVGELVKRIAAAIGESQARGWPVYIQLGVTPDGLAWQVSRELQPSGPHTSEMARGPRC